MISRKCKYAVKAILYIAQQADERPVLSTQIATHEQIPHKFLESILRELCTYGILRSKRGRNGGYLLLRRPEQISLTEIIRITDGPISLLPCVSLNYYAPCETCTTEENCVIRQVFLQVRDATLGIFDQTTVAGLVNAREQR